MSATGLGVNTLFLHQTAFIFVRFARNCLLVGG